MLTHESRTGRKIRGLAVPYSRFSVFGAGNVEALEVVQTGAFAAAVASGRSLRTGKPIFCCWGHRRDGRRRSDWFIASTADGRLRLEETPEGVYFELDNVKLPLDFTGVSVKLEPIRRVRESLMARRIVKAGITHIALLRAPETPCYHETFIETVRMST
jgi:hypothetical protein